MEDTYQMQIIYQKYICEEPMTMYEMQIGNQIEYESEEFIKNIFDL